MKLANTDYGRDLLCIDKKPYPIVSMRKNLVKYYLGLWDGRDHYSSDVRVGVKWGNVIRSRWQDVQRALDQVNLRTLLALPRLALLPNGRLVPVPAGAAETTAFPDPGDPAAAAIDGVIYRHGVDETLATIRAGAGTTLAAVASALYVRMMASTTSPQYQQLQRMIALFDASGGIPDTDTIDSAIVSLWVRLHNAEPAKQNSLTGEASENSRLHLVASTPASNTTLVNADFSQLGATSFGSSARQVDIVVDAYNAITVNATGLLNISKTGVTKFGFKNGWDLNNTTAGITWVSGGDQGIMIGQADNAGTTQDPKLVIQHSAAVGGKFFALF